MIVELPWVQRHPEGISLDAATVLYEDPLALHNLLVSPTGATCCLRRIPGKAEVVVWDGLPASRPMSWTGQPSLPLLEIFGFDGKEVYGRSETALLRIGPGDVRTLYETKAVVRAAALSPDRSRLVWIEGACNGEDYTSRLFTMPIGSPKAVRQARTSDNCASVLWLPEGTIVACQVHTVRGAEKGASIWVYSPEAEPIGKVLETRKWAIQPVRVGRPSTFFMSGERVDFYRPGIIREALQWIRRPNLIRRAKPPGPFPPRQSAMWTVNLGAPRGAECVANANPAGGTVEVFGDICLFADAWHQTADRSLLLSASPRRTVAALVPAFLRNFCLAGNTLLYCTLGQRPAVCALDLRPLL